MELVGDCEFDESGEGVAIVVDVAKALDVNDIVPDVLDEPLTVDDIDPNELCDATTDRVATLADELTEAVVPLDREVVPVRERVVVVEEVIVGVWVGVIVIELVLLRVLVGVPDGVGVAVVVRVTDPVTEDVKEGVRVLVIVGERVGVCPSPGIVTAKKLKQIRILESIHTVLYYGLVYVSEIFYCK